MIGLAILNLQPKELILRPICHMVHLVLCSLPQMEKLIIPAARPFAVAEAVISPGWVALLIYPPKRPLRTLEVK